MTLDIAARHQGLGKRQFAHLKAVLQKWKKEADGPLKEHRSQILSAYNTLSELLQRLESSNPPLSPKEFSRLVLTAHRIWDYYSSKFSQRGRDAQGRFLSEDGLFLDIADQLAYDCYRIAGDHLGKAPPLVVLTGGRQPYVQRRDSNFAVESGATPESLPPVAVAATSQLPFPIIGLPWFQASALEGLILVAHEVGHAIEDDLQLKEQLEGAFGACPESRSRNWQRWHRELFADVWGCLSVGPAFVHGLADQVAPIQPWQEPVEDTGPYPPAWLRFRFDCKVIARLGAVNPPDLQEFEKWEEKLPIHPAAATYLDDLEPILDALFRLHLPAIGRLGQGYTFTEEQHEESQRIAAMMAPGPPPFPSDNQEMRIAAAAARLAFEAAPKDETRNSQKLVLLKRAVKEGFRGVGDHAAEDKSRANGLFVALTVQEHSEPRIPAEP